MLIRMVSLPTLVLLLLNLEGKERPGISLSARRSV